MERIAEAMLFGAGNFATALYEAANVLLSRITRFSKLKRWGMDVAKRRGSKRAKVALARKIGVILQSIPSTRFRRDKQYSIAGALSSAPLCQLRRQR